MIYLYEDRDGDNKALCWIHNEITNLLYTRDSAAYVVITKVLSGYQYRIGASVIVGRSKLRPLSEPNELLKELL